MKWGRVGSFASLAVAFALFLVTASVLTGRVSAPGLAFVLCFGAAVVAAVLAGRPMRSLRTLGLRAHVMAAVGGLLAVFGAPAIVAAVRMSDAPAGSVVVFWIAGGWTALAALVVLGKALRPSALMIGQTAMAGAAALASVAGVAAVVANWERPSSFSPWVTFPAQQTAILAAGVLFIAGGILIARAGERGHRSGAPLTASLAALVASTAWLLAVGPADALVSVGELAQPALIAAVSWGAVCAMWASALATDGPARAAAPIVLAPVLMSALTWVEQATAVAGPQPFSYGGLVAGIVLSVAAALALLRTGGDASVVRQPGWMPLIPGTLAAVCALAGLLLPAITVHVRATPPSSGTFSSAWTLAGAEALAGWAALALAALLVAATVDLRTRALPFLGLVSCAAWCLLLDVPSHVLTSWLAPEIQSYYGTPYGSITFTPVLNVPMIAAVAITAVGFAVLLVKGLADGGRATDRPAIDAPPEA